MKICPVCREQNPEPNPFCLRCGYALAEVEKADDPPSEERESPVLGELPVGGATRTGLCECGAELPPGVTQCVYCGMTVSAVQGAPAPCVYCLRWSWGSTTPIRGRVFIGRVPPVTTELAQRLEQNYPNVSRLHAELFARDDGVYLCDHNSLNGTFLNGTRVAPGQDVPVPENATVRFASRLEATLVRNAEEQS